MRLCVVRPDIAGRGAGLCPSDVVGGRGGRFTCDQRVNRTVLRTMVPKVPVSGSRRENPLALATIALTECSELSV